MDPRISVVVPGVATMLAVSIVRADLTTPVALPPVVVVAPALMQGEETDAFSGNASVVGREQLVDLNAMDLGSSLRTVPGVSIARHNVTGSYGGSSGGGVFVRGMGASRPGGELVTLYDGVPRFNGVFGHPLLDLLSVDAAHAIRVYKGPQPQVFGNAFAAVDVTPRTAPREMSGAGAEVAGAYGSFDTVVESVSVFGREGGVDFFAGQSFRRSAGHRVNAGGELQDYFLHAGWTLNEHWTVAFTGDHTRNFAEDPGAEGQAFHQGDYSTRDFLGVLTVANTFERGEGYFKFYWNNGRALWRDQGRLGSGAPLPPPPPPPAAYNVDDTSVMNWDLFGVRARERYFSSDGGELVAGMDIDVESGKSRVERYPGSTVALARFPRHDFQIYSPYVALSQLFGEKNGLYAQPSLGMRFYGHSEFNSETAPHAGLIAGYKDTEWHASYARGVNYPGLNVVALTSINALGAANSWRNLKPETMDHFETGIRHRISPAWQVALTGFHDTGHNRYVLLTAPNSPPRGFQNINNYRNHGAEFAVTWTPAANLHVFAGATWMHTSVRGMPYAPQWAASAGLTWRFLENFRLGVDVLFQSRMHVSADGYGRSTTAENNASDNPEVPSFLLLNARLAYEFALPGQSTKTSEAFLALENIADQKYYYKPAYPMPGINAMAGLKIGF